jgi:Ca2+-transporting ATPase
LNKLFVRNSSVVYKQNKIKRTTKSVLFSSLLILFLLSFREAQTTLGIFIIVCRKARFFGFIRMLLQIWTIVQICNNIFGFVAKRGYYEKTMAENFWHNLSWEETIEKFDSDSEKGLSEKEVKFRRAKFGPNKISKIKQSSKIGIFLEQFKSPLVYILVVIGVAVLVLEKPPQSFIESGFVFAAVLINAVFGFWEEYKATKIFEKLQLVLKTKATVLRNGNKKEIFQEEIVPGDIVILGPGDKAPADGRLIETRNLKISEAVLTGEWMPAFKKIEILAKETPLADRDNMVYAGCLIEAGQGKAVITAIGKDTETGKIALLIKKTKDEKTPLQKKLVRMSKLIGAIIGFICLFIFIGGIIRQQNPVEMFEIAAAVAVGGIPESLPIIMTLILAIGMQKLSKKKALIRRLSSVETLGSTSVICADKTKTLTQGKMEVSELVSYENNSKVLKIGVLCNEAFIENPQEFWEKWKIRGDPTSKALISAGAKTGLLKPKLDKDFPLLQNLPFDYSRKYLACLRQEGEKTFLYISGAPEKILEISEKARMEKKSLQQKLKDLTEKGLRVIAVGEREIKPEDKNKKIEELIKDISFVGFIALKDPLRQDVKEAMKIVQEAGLRLIIITGDHCSTAKTVAQELDIKLSEENILEGKDLDKMSDQDLEKVIEKIKVYARSEPRHKIRIVRAWQAKGEIVAMTGDGVNDAPALKKADIGLALGSGTEAAKEVSDLILLNDSFSIIVKAIEEGRIILDNLRKGISYILADSFTSVILVGTSIILGWPLPILWIQILWNNIVEDTLPSLAYAFEPKEEGVMKRKPIPFKSRLLTKEMRILIFATGLIDEFLILCLFWYLWARLGLNLDYVRTMIFGAICIDTAFVVFCYKNLRKNIWQINLFNNKVLLFASLMVFVAFAAAVYLPPLQSLLHTVPLGIGDWLILIGMGIVSMFLIEITKWYFISRRETEL